MTYKSSKSLKKFPSEQSEQLELSEESSTSVDKVNHKRLSILIFLFFTVGISLCFLLYRRFRDVDFRQIITPPSIKLPSIAKPKYSPKIPETWFVSVLEDQASEFLYSTNRDYSFYPEEINTINDPTYAKKYLPDGVTVSEKINSTSDYLEIISQISSPAVTFQIYTKIPGQINSSSPEIDTFAKLAADFYWHLLK